MHLINSMLLERDVTYSVNFIALAHLKENNIDILDLQLFLIT